MFRRVFLVVGSSALMAGAHLEATAVRGVTITNEVGGQPMANVQIAAFGSSPAASDSLGMFTLEFPQKHPGDTVSLVVTKEGYEVVNDLQVTELTLPSPVEARIVTILLCKEGNREEMARRFYRLKSIEAVEETYKRRLKELEDKQQASAEALAKLQQQREEAIGAAGKAAEELAKAKPGESSELYREAMRLFMDGKVDEALQVLSGERLQRMAAEAKERKAQAEKVIEEAVQAWLLRARLLTVQFRFSEAEKAYQEAIETSPESLNAQFAFALFSQQLNRYKTAEPVYQRCLELARRSGNQGDVATTLNNLGILNAEQNRKEEARKAYEEAFNDLRGTCQTEFRAVRARCCTCSKSS
jgi:tetratricopeptide (TPR) repeat protein